MGEGKIPILDGKAGMDPGGGPRSSGHRGPLLWQYRQKGWREEPKGAVAKGKRRQPLVLRGGSEPGTLEDARQGEGEGEEIVLFFHMKR